MKISWGWKIAALYLGFVAMIICLIVACGHQNIDLVSKDYYADEVKYQDILNASKNQGALSGAFAIHADSKEVRIEFPQDFDKKAVSGSVLFYSAVNKKWDKLIHINNSNTLVIPLSELHRTVYEVKINYTVDGKQFYYQAQLDLHAS